MVRFVHLYCTKDTLSHSKEDSEENYQNGCPKRIPINSITPVNPELADGARSRLIKFLFQQHEPVVPELEILDLPFVGSKLAAFDCLFVKNNGW